MTRLGKMMFSGGMKRRMGQEMELGQKSFLPGDLFGGLTYEMEDGRFLHLEFENDSITEDDLRRFRLYDALLSCQYKTEVTTCVICTSAVKNPQSELKEGINRYQVQILRPEKGNADEIITTLEEKQKTGRLERQELMELILSPLMSGEMSQFDRISRIFRLLRGEEGNPEITDLMKMESVVYLLAKKFLQREELERVKTELHMTRLGKMMSAGDM